MDPRPSVTSFVYVLLIYVGLLAGSAALPEQYQNPVRNTYKADIVPARERTDAERAMFGALVSRDSLSWGTD